MPAKKAGRPKSPKLTRRDILEEAIKTLEAEGAQRFSMRSLARALDVDPMAIYHYFAGKDELLSALSQQLFASVGTIDGHAWQNSTWQAGIEHLAESYLQVVSQAPELTRMICRGETPMPDIAARFETRVGTLLAGRACPTQAKLFAHVIVDFLHGFAMASGALDLAAWRQEFGVILRGIEAMTEEHINETR